MRQLTALRGRASRSLRASGARAAPRASKRGDGQIGLPPPLSVRLLRPPCPDVPTRRPVHGPDESDVSDAMRVEPRAIHALLDVVDGPMVDAINGGDGESGDARSRCCGR